MRARQARVSQGDDGEHRIPYRGDTGLQAEGIGGFDAKALDGLQSFRHWQRAQAIAQAHQSQDGVHHGWHDPPPVPSMVLVLECPLLSPPHSGFA
jgi:hypothetical protein